MQEPIQLDLFDLFENETNTDFGYSLVIYTGDNCPACTRTKQFLDKHAVQGEYLPVQSDQSISDTLTAEGWKSLPVVKYRSNTLELEWSGFRPDLLVAINRDIQERS